MHFRSLVAFGAALSTFLPSGAWADSTPRAAGRPQLVVAISVDQFSADLFNQYRPTWSGGLHRLTQGVVFPKGYESHAATETCPGHSTILTGNRPGHTGIIANNWIDQSVQRAEKSVYCAEDPAAPGATAKDYAASLKNLRVPTLGDRMKAADPGARVIAVSGKDRAALMMGGHDADQIWWWGAKGGFGSYAGRPVTPLVSAVNAAVQKTLDVPRTPLPVPQTCQAVDHPVAISDKTTVGTGQFARPANDLALFRASPEFDAAVLALAGALVDDQKLGRQGHTDLLAISLSANDYIGHRYGTAGSEMCIQMAELDQSLGDFFDHLDQSGVDYIVMLTADHGGLDTPERNRENGEPDAQRVTTALLPGSVNAALEQQTGIKGPLLLADSAFGDVYLRKDLTAADKAKVSKAALAYWQAQPQVQTVFTHAQLLAAPEPSGPPEAWSLLQEAKASFDPERSGDFLVLLKPRVTPIADPDHGYVATHGSPWDYDRRVPILFWRKGIVPFEQPLGVETVDIMPTLAAQIGLALPATGYDGRCLDLVAGPETSCPLK